jgi:hypothetical protein
MSNEQNMLERRGQQQRFFDVGYERNATTGKIIHTGRESRIAYTPKPISKSKPCPPCLPCTPNGRRMSLRKLKKLRKSRKVRKN